MLKFVLATDIIDVVDEGFSALQRAEIAEIVRRVGWVRVDLRQRFSALQRAEIAEIALPRAAAAGGRSFQCSSTSRNC